MMLIPIDRFMVGLALVLVGCKTPSVSDSRHLPPLVITVDAIRSRGANLPAADVRVSMRFHNRGSETLYLERNALHPLAGMVVRNAAGEMMSRFPLSTPIVETPATLIALESNGHIAFEVYLSQTMGSDQIANVRTVQFTYFPSNDTAGAYKDEVKSNICALHD